MTDEGLEISEREFCKMKQSDQNLILYKNVKEIKKIMAGYNIYYKVTATLLGLLVPCVSFLYYLILTKG